jgi:hypothetical protein
MKAAIEAQSLEQGLTLHTGIKYIQYVSVFLGRAIIDLRCSESIVKTGQRIPLACRLAKKLENQLAKHCGMFQF